MRHPDICTVLVMPSITTGRDHRHLRMCTECGRGGRENRNKLLPFFSTANVFLSGRGNPYRRTKTLLIRWTCALEVYMRWRSTHLNNHRFIDSKGQILFPFPRWPPQTISLLGWIWTRCLGVFWLLLIGGITRRTSCAVHFGRPLQIHLVLLVPRSLSNV